MENPREDRFIRIATARTNKILDDLRLLGNCANGNNYQYTSEQVDKMFGAIQDALIKARAKFEGEKKEKFTF